MELETLFTQQKWNILSALSESKHSPLQLADRTNTTIANISQQLRLLEAAHLIKKEKVRNRDKGKPRTLFSLSNDYAYIISAIDGFADKKLLKLDNFHKLLFKTWFFEDPELQYCTEKFLWGIERHIRDIDLIAIKPTGEKMNIVVSTKNKKIINEKVKELFRKGLTYKSQIPEIQVITIGEAKDLIRNEQTLIYMNFLVIYDPLRLFENNK